MWGTLDKTDTTGVSDNTSCLEERCTKINLLTPSSGTGTQGHQRKLAATRYQTIKKSAFSTWCLAGLGNTFPKDVINARSSVYTSSEERSIQGYTKCKRINNNHFGKQPELKSRESTHQTMLAQYLTVQQFYERILKPTFRTLQQSEQNIKKKIHFLNHVTETKLIDFFKRSY